MAWMSLFLQHSPKVPDLSLGFALHIRAILVLMRARSSEATGVAQRMAVVMVTMKARDFISGGEGREKEGEKEREIGKWWLLKRCNRDERGRYGNGSQIRVTRAGGMIWKWERTKSELPIRPTGMAQAVRLTDNQFTILFHRIVAHQFVIRVGNSSFG